MKNQAVDTRGGKVCRRSLRHLYFWCAGARPVNKKAKHETIGYEIFMQMLPTSWCAIIAGKKHKTANTVNTN